MENKQDYFILEMSLIRSYLVEARDHGLETEVVMWAIKAMKEDPSLHISQAMELGFYEWVK
jgi:hypothetical protein